MSRGILGMMMWTGPGITVLSIVVAIVLCLIVIDVLLGSGNEPK